MYIPPNFSTVTPYLILENADGFIQFARAAFKAVEVGRSPRDDGKITHAQIRIGNSMLMVSDNSVEYPPMPSTLYIFVENADQSVKRAIDAGAILEMPVSEQAYGDRQGGVRDNFGNIWWISQRLENKPYF